MTRGAGNRIARVLPTTVAIFGFLAGTTSLGATPEGYERVKVKRAGISLAMPDSFEVTNHDAQEGGGSSGIKT